VNPSFSDIHLRDEASTMVAENWDAIKAMAVQLLEDKTLEEDELTIIVDAIDEDANVNKIMIGTCERCCASGPMKEIPCHACKGFHALCEKCRETYERFYFCEWCKCFLTEPILRPRGVKT
jgi:hypothetical protein